MGILIFGKGNFKYFVGVNSFCVVLNLEIVEI